MKTEEKIWTSLDCYYLTTIINGREVELTTRRRAGTVSDVNVKIEHNRYVLSARSYDSNGEYEFAVMVYGGWDECEVDIPFSHVKILINLQEKLIEWKDAHYQS